MGPMSGQTSVCVRELVIFHYKEGKSLRQTGEIVNRTHSTVQGIINRYKKTKDLKTRSEYNLIKSLLTATKDGSSEKLR